MVLAAQNELIHSCKTLLAQQYIARYMVPNSYHHLGLVIQGMMRILHMAKVKRYLTRHVKGKVKILYMM